MIHLMVYFNDSFNDLFQEFIHFDDLFKQFI